MTTKSPPATLGYQSGVNISTTVSQAVHGHKRSRSITNTPTSSAPTKPDPSPNTSPFGTLSSSEGDKIKDKFKTESRASRTLHRRDVPIVINQEDVKNLIKTQSRIRGWIARNRLRKLRLSYKRRNEICQQLIVTERAYLDRLRMLIDTFVRPLRLAIATSNDVISESQCKTIFFEIDVIVFYNSEFLQQLEKRVSNWDHKKSRLGSIFLSLADFLSVYIRYIKNYRNACVTARNAANENKGFANFLSYRRSLPQCYKMEIEDLLALPVQRIVEYSTMIEELLYLSFTDEQDFRHLQSAKDMLSEAINIKNELIGPTTFSKLLSVESTSEPISEPSTKKKLLSIATASGISLPNLVSRKKEAPSTPQQDREKMYQTLALTYHPHLVQRDEDLWKILSLVLHAMEIPDEQGLLNLIEMSLEKPPNRLRNIQIMNKIYKKSKQYLNKNNKEASIIKIQALMRGRSQRKKFKDLGRRFGEMLGVRNKAFRELLTSERNYVEQLNITVKQYLWGIRDMARKKVFVVGSGDLASVFSNVETLLEIHEQLLSQLETIYLQWPSLENIGEFFLKLIPLMKPYTEYVKNFKCAGDTLLRAQSEVEKFSGFLNEMASQTARGYGNLGTLLSAPLYRISNYKMQLETLKDSTPSTHPDYTNLYKAHQAIIKLNNEIEKASKKAKDFAEFSNVKRRLDVTDQSILGVFEGKRKYVREGNVTLMEGKNKEKRYIFMFNDMCLVTKPNAKTGKTFIYLRTIPISEDSTVESIADTTFSKHALKIKSQRDFQVTENYFYFKTLVERDEWLRDVQRNIAYNKKKRAKRDKRRSKKDSGSESSDSVQVEKPIALTVTTPSLHDRRMSLTEDLHVEKTIEKQTVEKSESESSESDSPSKKLTIGGILMKMKDRKKPANKKYLTWGPSSEEEAATVEPSSPSKKEDNYLNSLKSIIEESKVETVKKQPEAPPPSPVKELEFVQLSPKRSNSSSNIAKSSGVHIQETSVVSPGSPGKRTLSTKNVLSRKN